MSQSRRNKRMGERLQREVRSKASMRLEMGFITSLNHENQMLNALVVQKQLTRKIRGNIIRRYFNWVLGINPMLKIMVDREKLQSGISDNGATPDKGGHGADKAGKT